MDERRPVVDQQEDLSVAAEVEAGAAELMPGGHRVDAEVAEAPFALEDQGTELADQAMGPLGLVPLPTKWSLDFGDPIPVSEYGPQGAEDPILVNRLTQEVRATIQRMLDARLARRRSIWFG